ncbi:HNH endonuclease [Lysobacter sp. P5_B9]
MLPFGVGVSPNTPWIKGVIRHEQSGLLVDPKAGVVYGVLGRAIGGVCADGYVRLGGYRDKTYLYAHRLVWETVNGPIPDGLEIDHLNGDKADNRARNLEAVTKSENVRRAIKKGLAPVGSQRPEAKLTEELVQQIRSTAGVVTNAEWARRLGVEKTTIRHARMGKTWRHVPMRGRAKAAASTGTSAGRSRRTTSRNRRRR